MTNAWDATPRADAAGNALPAVIQGGMGVAVSGWRLARAVSSRGALGIVSGTALDTVLVRRLQDGDGGGDVRRALARFPLPRIAEETLRRFFRPNGRAPDEPYALLPLPKQTLGRAREELTVLAAFVEVSLAKEGHGGKVGINLLTKIQIPNLALLYGALLAGVDCVAMGAGIPREIPGALDALAEHRAATMRFDVEGASEFRTLEFDPSVHGAASVGELLRPEFYPIVASHSLATMLAKKANGRVDGFIVEGHTAGGHNAPPRGELVLDAHGEPVYGPRDEVEVARIAELGLPFWLAGGRGSPESLAAARAAGAAGIQVGTLFAYCDESGLDPTLKREVLAEVASGGVSVRTDPRASPTGFPFKLVRWNDGLAPSRERERVCDLGYLRTAYALPDGRVGYRCPSEPVERFCASGGSASETEGRVCLCNGLLAAAGFAQTRGAHAEPPLVTSGDDLTVLSRFLAGRTSYSAADVLDWLGAPNRQFCRS
ncbi:MAG: nitronate monooxygenase [Planctomycetes bacterium]|nr:nitronate monooxygenase [Planctomycetota bacterium]